MTKGDLIVLLEAAPDDTELIWVRISGGPGASGSEDLAVVYDSANRLCFLPASAVAPPHIME